MAFVTGLMLIDAPASALNNAGGVEGRLTKNTVGVKAISTREGRFPYVSAQAFRYWLRTTLERAEADRQAASLRSGRGAGSQKGAPEPDDTLWKAAPVYREENVAYTEADPIEWWDDDLFGYMRAPATGPQASKSRQTDPAYQKLTQLDRNSKGNELTLTRVSPLRVSTLVSIAPATIVEDFESMSRQEGDPVPYSGQFYRATLKGLFSLDLHASGTFWHRQRTGFRNLDRNRSGR